MSTNPPPGEHSPKRHWTVARVDTEPMTTQEYNQAVTALASLISQWKRAQESPEEDRESQQNGTISLPFPRGTRDNGTGTDIAR